MTLASRSLRRSMYFIARVFVILASEPFRLVCVSQNSLFAADMKEGKEAMIKKT